MVTRYPDDAKGRYVLCAALTFRDRRFGQVTKAIVDVT
jgi:hypothetical protein